MCRAVKSGVVCNQKFAAPDRAVRSIAGAVKGNTDHELLTVQTVFGHARGDVGMVMLNGDAWRVMRNACCVASAEVIGVQVVSDDFGRDAEERLKMRDAFFEG